MDNCALGEKLIRFFILILRILQLNKSKIDMNYDHGEFHCTHFLTPSFWGKLCWCLGFLRKIALMLGIWTHDSTGMVINLHPQFLNLVINLPWSAQNFVQSVMVTLQDILKVKSFGLSWFQEKVTEQNFWLCGKNFSCKGIFLRLKWGWRS